MVSEYRRTYSRLPATIRLWNGVTWEEIRDSGSGHASLLWKEWEFRADCSV